MSDSYQGFSVKKHYRKMIIWSFNSQTRRLTATFTITPRRGMTKRERYDEFERILKEHSHFGLTMPAYEDGKAAK